MITFPTPCLEWPTPTPDPQGRRTAVALLNPGGWIAGEAAHWYAGPLDDVLDDALTHADLHGLPTIMHVFDDTGHPRFTLTIRGIDE